MKNKLTLIFISLLSILASFTVYAVEIPSPGSPVDYSFYGRFDGFDLQASQLAIEDYYYVYDNNSQFFDSKNKAIIDIKRSKLKQGSYVKYHVYTTYKEQLIISDLTIISKQEFNKQEKKQQQARAKNRKK